MGDTSEILRQSEGGNTEFLVSKAKEGSDAAWREIYRRYRVMLIAQVQAIFPSHRGGRFHAEDALQQAFTNAWANIRGFQYRDEGAFRRWLAKLVLNAFKNEIAKRGSRESQADSGELRALPDETPAGDHARKQLAESVLEALGKLDEVDRDLVIQHEVEDRSFDSIAETVGASREKVRQMYLAAMKRLTRLLSDR